MSKSVRNIVIAVVAIMLMAVGIVVLNNIEPKQEETVVTEENGFTICEETTEEIDSVEVKYAENTIKAVKNGDSQWKIDGFESDDIDPSKAYGLVGTVSSLTSKNKIEENPSDLAQYGLETPQLTVTMNKADGEIIKLNIGDMSPTLGEYFLMKEGDNTVYTIYSFKVDTLMQPLDYYREFDRFNVVIDDITNVKIARSDETIEIKIVDNIDENTNNVWEMVSPYVCGANDDYIDNKILSPIESISLSKPVTDNDGGITDSSHVLTMTIRPYDDITSEYGEEYTETLVIGKTEDSMTYVKYGDDIFTTPAESISFVNDSAFNIASKLQALVDISEVKCVTLDYNDKSHKIDIKTVGEETQFSLDGKKANTEISRSIYQGIIGLAVDGIYANEPLGDTVLKVSYEGIKSDSDTVIEIKSIDDINCALTRNGKTEFTIKKNEIAEFIELFEEYVNNPQ